MFLPICLLPHHLSRLFLVFQGFNSLHISLLMYILRLPLAVFGSLVKIFCLLSFTTVREITVLPSFSDACHFDHSFVCIDTKDTNLCDTKLSPNPTKNGHDTCANRAKHLKFANITNSEDSPERENPHCGCAGQTKSCRSTAAECRKMVWTYDTHYRTFGVV